MTQAPPPLTRRTAHFWLLLPAVLAGCDLAPMAPRADLPEPGVFEATRDGPAGAPDGSCWGKTVSPAVVQTTQEQVQIKPAKVSADGTITSLPRYRTQIRQQIVHPRMDNWFETPCADVLSPEFIASLQRALTVRGFYAGAINGVLDGSTRAAVQGFQRAEGPDSPVLALETARKLGLIAVARDISSDGDG